MFHYIFLVFLAVRRYNQPDHSRQFEPQIASTTSSLERREKVLDFFGQFFDIFLTMNKATENKGFIYEFGKFVLDPQERILFADGKPVHLADKVFDTLLVLIENNGRLLTKDEMMISIWEESFVEEGNLAKNISRLRKILNADGASLIETLPKRGYRFRADVRELDGETNLLVHRNLRVKVIQTVENGSEPDELKLHSESVLNEIHSIAVLPFQPLDSRADDDIFGLGLTDALITQLSRAGQIQVRPTSSILKYNVSQQNAISIGRELQVDAILEGRFQRYENKLRLTVQMLRAANGDSLWADGFNAEVEDIFTIQDLIAGRVIGALTKKLSGEAQARLNKRDTENVEAFQEYLRGRYFWNKRTADDLKEALKCFERAVEIDPLFALAHAGIADIYNQFPAYDELAPRDSFPKAKAAILRALELDETLAEAHASLGFTLLNYDWNWAGAEVSFQQAIKLNPNYATAHHWYGTFLLRQERFGEAIAALKNAQNLDPSSPVISTWLAEALNYCGETEAAIALHRATLDLAENFFPAYYHLALIYAACRRFDEARETANKALNYSHEISLALSLSAVLHITLGEIAVAEKMLAKLLEKRQARYVSAVNIAEIYANLDNENEALDWLERAYTERDPNLTWLKVDKEYKQFQNNPRFQRLLEQIGLAEIRNKSLPSALRAPRPKMLWLALGVFSILIISALGFYFWQREKSISTVNQNKFDAIRLTDNPQADSYPHWTKDGHLRFLRTADKHSKSFSMNADGTNQIEVKGFNNFDYGFWSPDETKVLFAKRDDKNAYYLAGADGANEILLPFFGGNFDWSPDGKKIVYQKAIAGNNSELFIYSLETGESKNITANPEFDADPNFSPDGRQIAFASLRDGNAEIYLMNSDGGDVRRLTNHPAWDSHPVFSPDGTTIAFSSDRENENSDVYLMNTDGGAVKRLTDWKTEEFVLPGCWSPDGTQIAFTSDRAGSNDIYVISAEVYKPELILADEKTDLQSPNFSPDGKQIVYQAELEDKSGELRITGLESRQSRVLLKTENTDAAPVFSPDGERIAFQNRIEGNTEICTIKPDGSDLTNLSNNAARDITPAFSPDGKQIVFASNRDGNYGVFQLYAMNADGGNPHQIYRSNGMNLSPAWSPNGGQIIFASDKEGRTGNFEIFSIGFETGEAEKRLTFRPRYDTQPAISPDGKRIAFTSDADGNAEIYLMNADGTNLLRLTRNLAEDDAPQFSKDGRKIMFSSNRSGKYALYEIEF
ncbi:MAG: winged helix-turn-helix domain-containing protein [Pyrinomonadaceae bacterium]